MISYKEFMNNNNNNNIFNPPETYYRYARYILKGRWIEKEKYILLRPPIAFLYAKYVIFGRWEEFEIKMTMDLSSNQNILRRYIKTFIGNSWPDKYPPEGPLYERWYDINMEKIFPNNNINSGINNLSKNCCK